MIAKPRNLRLSQRGRLIPQARFQEWHDLAMRIPGLTELDRKLLDVIAVWYRRLYVEEFAGSLSYQRMAQRIGAEPRSIRFASSRKRR